MELNEQTGLINQGDSLDKAPQGQDPLLSRYDPGSLVVSCVLLYVPDKLYIEGFRRYL